MNSPVNILVDFEAMYFYSSDKADQFRVIESAFLLKQNKSVLTQFCSKIHLDQSYAQRAHKRVLKLLQLTKADHVTFPDISVTTKGLIKIEKYLKNLDSNIKIQFVCWGSEDKKYLSALIDQVNIETKDCLDKKWWLSLNWFRLDSKYKSIIQREKGTALSKAFTELKESRLVRGELPANIYNALDDCRILEKVFQSYEVGNFERLYQTTQPKLPNPIEAVEKVEEVKSKNSQTQNIKTEDTVAISGSNLQELINEIRELKQEVHGLKHMIYSLTDDSCSTVIKDTQFSLNLSQLL